MDYKKYTWIAGGVALACIAFASIANGLGEFKSLKHPNGTQATITVTGEGEVTALPDIATITITVRESAKTVPEVQKLVEAKVTKAIESVSALGVDKKDTKTLSYTVNPKYEYINTPVIYSGSAYMPVQSKQKLVGYEVAETIQIKVRKVDTAGDVIGALGTANITEISGPEFTVDDMDKAQADAKEIAIKKARAKAKETAKALGAHLGEVVQFSENSGGYYPMYYKGAAAPMAAESSDRVTIPTGESVIKSNVSITYSID